MHVPQMTPKGAIAEEGGRGGGRGGTVEAGQQSLITTGAEST